MRPLALIAIGAAVICLKPAPAVTSEARHAIAMHGQPALPAGFEAFSYVNPLAPKNGRLVQGLLGAFDSLNPLIVKGLSLPAIRGYVIESLMTRGYDEPFTLYGLLANTIETDTARSYVIFTLDPAARFSDGKPVTAKDVIFSWQILRDKGRPNHRAYYAKVAKAEAIGERAVRFDLAGNNDRELPLILGLMPVLAKHAVDPATFEDTSFAPPVGSGPYIVSTVDPGKSVTLKRNPDYWGRNLAVNRGFWNFDEVRFDFYRDANAHLEAFRKGLYDIRIEHDPSQWQTAYNFPAARAGRVIKDAFPNGLPKGMVGWVFNTRRPVFADVRVREAILHLFDFEWVNKNYFHGLYQRTGSFYDGSELSSHGIPAGARERVLLAPFLHEVRSDVLEGSWSPPQSDGSGRDRAMLKRALMLFSDAGYDLVGAEMRDRTSGRPFTFDILLLSKEEERLALAFAQSLKRAGISSRIRLVDAVQYDRRRISYDFDMIRNRWDQSLSPGNEQAFYWGLAAASEDGTRNYMGVKSPAVDAMIAAMLKAEPREDFIAAVRALDRVLLSGFYAIPLFHLPDQWVARWTRIGRPEKTSLSGFLPETWWREPQIQ